MTKFLILYTGGMGDMSASPEEMQAEMKKWIDWMATFGSDMLIPGAPTSDGAKEMDGNNVTDCSMPVTGYTVVQGNNIDEVIAKCQACPQLSVGGKVHVYPTVDMPGM